MKITAAKIAEFLSQPLALAPEYCRAYLGLLGNADDSYGERLLAASASEIQAARGRAAGASAGNIMVVPVIGVISQRGDFMDEIFGGGSVPAQQLAQTIRQLGSDGNVAGIVLDIDSPGGSVGGLAEVGDAIFSLRGVKPCIAIADSLAASAAYWIGSAADEFVITPEGQAGSIGVWTAHMDYSGYLEQLGVKATLVSAGKYKTEGNPYGPLDDAAKAHMQEMVDDYYGMFVAAVARNRKDTQTNVREGYGQGRCLTAKDAVKAKLVDRVATLGEVVGGMQVAVKASGWKAAQARINHLAQAKRTLEILS